MSSLVFQAREIFWPCLFQAVAPDTHLRGDARILRNNARPVRSNARTLRSNARTPRSNACSLRNNVRTLRGNARTVRSNARTLHGNARTLRNNARTLHGNARRHVVENYNERHLTAAGVKSSSRSVIGMSRERAIRSRATIVGLVRPRSTDEMWL